MNKSFWEAAWFVVRVGLKYSLRILVAPIVGGFRETSRLMARMHAETRAFVEAQDQRAERNPTRSFNA
jgi:hypothetical protein